MIENFIDSLTLLDYLVIAANKTKTKEMFEDAFQRTLDPGIPMESNTHIEVKVIETGDHAVTRGVLQHIKKVDNILSIRRYFRELIFKTPRKYSVDLATPINHLTH